MVATPKKGRVYWYVTDFYEQFYEVPVRFDGKFIKWHLGDGLYHNFGSVSGHDKARLFRKRKAAIREAARMNKELRGRKQLDNGW